MAAEASVSVLLLVFVALVGVALMFLALVTELYQRIQLWNYISEDEELPDPLEILYQYKAEEVENQ